MEIKTETARGEFPFWKRNLCGMECWGWLYRLGSYDSPPSCLKPVYGILSDSPFWAGSHNGQPPSWFVPYKEGTSELNSGKAVRLESAKLYEDRESAEAAYDACLADICKKIAETAENVRADMINQKRRKAGQ